MSRYNPNHENAPAVFDAAQKFKQRCLLGQKSLFLPDTALWTSVRLESLVESFVNQPDDGKRSFAEKLKDQLAVCEPLEVALMAEVYWTVQLGTTNLGPNKKIDSVRGIWNLNPPDKFPIDSEFLAKPVLSGLGSGGPGYNQYIPKELAFALQAFAALSAKLVAEREAVLSNGLAFARWLDSVPSSKGRQFYHVLCHLLFPDEFERVFSGSQKIKAARAHGIYTRALDEDRPALDSAFLELRKRLEAHHGAQIDYYHPPVNTLAPDANTDDHADSDGDAAALPTIDSIADANPVGPAQTGADNMIFHGPPGTGKTHAMEALMRTAYEAGGDFEFVAFHPNFSYEDFVGGLRPAAENGGTILRFHKGPFIRLCERAHADPTRRFTLFIDEINRANVAKVFGELITLLEPGKRVPAGSTADDRSIGLWITLPATNEVFGVPDNLDVVATMNSADRSISPIDVALRRRFRFKEFPSRPETIVPSTVDGIDLVRLVRRLNERIECLLDRDHVIGHVYFLGIQTIDDLRDVFVQRVLPLLQEYFFDDLAKVQMVLCGHDGDGKFLRSRILSPSKLFSATRGAMSTEPIRAYVVGDPATWTEADFVSVYDSENADAAGQVAQIPG